MEVAALLLCLVALTLLGVPVVRAFLPGERGARLVAEAFLCGCGVASMALLALSVAAIRWTPPAVAVAAAGVPLLLALRRRPPVAKSSRLAVSPLLVGAGALVALIAAGHALRCWESGLTAHDFVAIWGLKGKTFFLHHGIDWGWLGDRENVTIQSDYPLLLPLLLDFVALCTGGWSEPVLALTFTAFGVASILLLIATIRRESASPLPAALGWLALAAPALTLWPGLAEAPLAAFVLAGLVAVRRALEEGDARAMGLGGLLLGFAAFTKNEGAILLVGVVVALAAIGRIRAATPLAWALLPAAPWWAIRWKLGLGSYFSAGEPLIARLQSHARQAGEIAAALVREAPPKPWFYLLCAAVIALLFRVSWRRERFLLLVLALQVAAYVAAYFVTPFDAVEQIRYSWGRILEPVGLVMGFVAVSVVIAWYDELRIEN